MKERKKRYGYEYSIKVIETGQVYNTYGDCAEALGMSKSSVSSCLNGYSKTCGGYHLELVPREWPDELDPFEWREHPWLKAIYSNRDGDIVSYRSGRVKKMHPTLARTGYLMVGIGTRDATAVHRIIAETWLPNPYQKSSVNHIDGNKLNNFVENLEWVSHKENSEHAYRTGLAYPNRRRPVRIVETGTEFVSVTACAEFFNVSLNVILKCLYDCDRTHAGYHFVYI